MENMDYDPLAKYRKSKPVPSALVQSANPVREADEYVAFTARDTNRRLRIRCLRDQVSAPSYDILFNVDYDNKGTFFTLVYSIMLVEVQGENLHKLIYALENDLADYIQVYDPARWPKPVDTKAAFIRSIKITVMDGAKLLPETSLEAIRR